MPDNGNGSASNYAVWPIDDHGLVYYGRDLEDQSRSVFLILEAQIPTPDLDKIADVDIDFGELLRAQLVSRYHDWEVVDLNERPYAVLPWDDRLDNLLVAMVDRIVNARMRNLSRVSFALQMEMPLDG